MEQLSQDIANLHNLVDVYQPTSFEDDAERKERYNVLTSKYNELFSTLSHCVGGAMHELLLAREELNDNDIEEVAAVVEDMYGALDQKLLATVTFLEEKDNQFLSKNNSVVSTKQPDPFPEKKCIATNEDALLVEDMHGALDQNLLAIVTLLEEQNKQILNGKNSVVSNLIKKFEMDEKSIAVNSPHVDQTIFDLLIKGSDYPKNIASNESEVESGLDMHKPPKRDPFPKKKGDLEIDGKDFCMSGCGGNDVTSFKVYATKDVASTNDGSIKVGLGDGEFGMDVEGAGDSGNGGEKGISLKGIGCAVHGGRKSGNVAVAGLQTKRGVDRMDTEELAGHGGGEKFGFGGNENGGLASGDTMVNGMAGEHDVLNEGEKSELSLLQPAIAFKGIHAGNGEDGGKINVPKALSIVNDGSLDHVVGIDTDGEVHDASSALKFKQTGVEKATVPAAESNPSLEANGQGEVGTGGEKAHANGNDVSGLVLGLMSKPETLHHQVSTIAGYFVSIAVLSSRAIVKYCNIGMGSNCKARNIGKPVSCRYWNLKLYSMVLLVALGLLASPQVLGHNGANQEESPFANSNKGILQDDSVHMLEIKGGIKKEDGRSAVIDSDKGFASTEPSIHDGGNVAVAKAFTLGDGMKHIETKRASLRGSNDIDSAAEMTEVEDFSKSQLTSMIEFQKHREDGDNDRAGFALKLIGETDSLVEMNKDFKEDKLDFLSSFDGKSFILDDIPKEQLIKNHNIVLKEEENSLAQQICPKSFPDDRDDIYTAKIIDRPNILKAAVTAYVDQDCANKSDCVIGQEWGYPINSWCVEQVTNFKDLFSWSSAFNEDINGWTTSQVTNMNGVFYYAKAFNQQLNNWNVSSVTTMGSMFYHAKAFNQPLGNWNINSVNTMGSMFSMASAFNQPLNNWDVSSVNTMGGMFYQAKAFNQPLDNWDVSSITSMWSMFDGAQAFNQPLNNWNVSLVTNMNSMFKKFDTVSLFSQPLNDTASSFNQPLINWDVSSVTDMCQMFNGASAFNQPLNDWDVSSVHIMFGMFDGAQAFNQPLDNWNVSLVTIMFQMFNQANAFNQPLNDWNVSSVIIMWSMFGASAFNQPLNNWDVSSVISMNSMFIDARAFNQPLNNWNVSSVTSMDSMFMNASAFNQPLNDWNVSSVTSMDSMLYQANAFNQPLNDWDVSSVTNMKSMFIDARAFNQPLNNWDVSSVASMNSIFMNASAFNEILNNWDVSSVTDMCQMFRGASAFNQSLNNWDVSSVTNMNSMFEYVHAFNQPLSNWDVSSVISMGHMFLNASAFNQDLCQWGAYYDSVKGYFDMFGESACPNTNSPTSLYGHWCQECFEPSTQPSSQPTAQPSSSSQPSMMPSYQPTLKPSAQPSSSSKPTPTPATYYIGYNTGGCTGRNELTPKKSLTKAVVEECAAACDEVEACVSFEYKKSGTACLLSTSCDDFSLTVDDPKDNYMWYLKVTDDAIRSKNKEGNAYLWLLDNLGQGRVIPPLGLTTTNYYIGYSTGGCPKMNEGYKYKQTVQECAAACDAENYCISFEFKKEGKTNANGYNCVLSKDCTYDSTVKKTDDAYMWYEKSDGYTMHEQTEGDAYLWLIN